jgi:hypothetical protein
MQSTANFDPQNAEIGVAYCAPRNRIIVLTVWNMMNKSSDKERFLM